MPDEKPPEDENPDERTPSRSGSLPLKPGGEVVLPHFDAPPPSGKQRIHDRRPLPLVPDRRPDDHPDEADSQDPNSR